MADEVLEIKKTPKAKTYPAVIKMTKPYGFVDDAGSHHYWFQGMLVDVPEQIAEIIDHKCLDFTVE